MSWSWSMGLEVLEVGTVTPRHGTPIRGSFGGTGDMRELRGGVRVSGLEVRSGISDALVRSRTPRGMRGLWGGVIQIECEVLFKITALVCLQAARDICGLRRDEVLCAIGGGKEARLSFRAPISDQGRNGRHTWLRMAAGGAYISD